MEQLHDGADPRLDPYRSLDDPTRRAALEGEAGIFMAEGAKVVARLLEIGVVPRSLLVDVRRLAKFDEIVAEADRRGTAVLVATADIVRATVGFDLHRGLVAVCVRPRQLALPDVLAGARRVVVLEGLNDHENLGVIFRTAAALGVDGVVLDPRCADPLYRRTVRVSIGNSSAVPWCRADAWPEALGAVRSAGFTVAGLVLDGSVELADAGLADVDRLALLVGAEGPGLTAAARGCVDLAVRIRMERGVDSLNVATAAALAIHAARPVPRR